MYFNSIRIALIVLIFHFRISVQTVQTLGADCADFGCSSGPGKNFGCRLCRLCVQQRAGNEVWVQTVQTLRADFGCRLCRLWVQTELEIPRVGGKWNIKTTKAIQMMLNYMSLDYFCERSRTCHFSELESFAFSRKSIFQLRQIC